MEFQLKDLYKLAGVDIGAGERSAAQIAELVKKIRTPGVVSGIGGFAGLFRLGFEKYNDPLLVSATDGVGTKLKIAQELGVHDTVGIDLVAMCVNDILTIGAQPLFFLDYISIGKLEENKVTQIIKGVIEGCRQSECALLGGETAEHPGVMDQSDYDLAGFVVGVVDGALRIDGLRIKEDDSLIGIASSGLHSNGYSLVRKLIADSGLELDAAYAGIDDLGKELLRPTRIYRNIVKSLTENFSLKGMAHITGGGITKNLPRILPEGFTARIELNSWEKQPIFGLLQNIAGADQRDMLSTFNMGIGYVLVADQNKESDILAFLNDAGEEAWPIGKVVEGDGGIAYV